MRRLAYFAAALAAACSNSTTTDDAFVLPDLSIVDSGAHDLRPGVDQAPPDGGGPGGSLCTPNAFVRCSGNNAIYCNASGTGTTNFDCGGACVGAGGCGICTPGSTTCATGMLTTCTPQGSHGAPAACVTLGA